MMGSLTLAGSAVYAVPASLLVKLADGTIVLQ